MPNNNNKYVTFSLGKEINFLMWIVWQNNHINNMKNPLTVFHRFQTQKKLPAPSVSEGSKENQMSLTSVNSELQYGYSSKVKINRGKWSPNQNDTSS